MKEDQRDLQVHCPRGRLPIAVRCRDCGEPGRSQVRPPLPTLDPQRRGWMGPPQK